MRNIKELVTREEVHEHCAGLLRSEIFKQSYETKGFVFDIIDQFAQLPRIACDYTDHDLERPHFYPYMGVLANRDYENPALSDLFYLHDIGHSIVAGYQVDQVFSLWVNRLNQEEACTSVLTELMVYFELPGLREQVFQDQEIWADRFLTDKVKIYEGKEDRLPDCLPAGCSNWQVYQHDPELFRLMAMERRSVIMQSSNPEKLDEQERLINAYATNNFRWATIWRPIKDEVEKSMLMLAQASTIDRQLALQAHLAFLLEKKGDDACPFMAEAAAFREVIRAFQERSDEKFLDQETT